VTTGTLCVPCLFGEGWGSFFVWCVGLSGSCFPCRCGGWGGGGCLGTV